MVRLENCRTGEYSGYLSHRGGLVMGCRLRGKNGGGGQMPPPLASQSQRKSNGCRGGALIEMWGQICRTDYTIVAVFNGFLVAGMRLRVQSHSVVLVKDL